MLVRFAFAATSVHRMDPRGTPPGLRAASPEGGRRAARGTMDPRGTSEVVIL